MPEFIAALRQLQRPLVMLAAAILVAADAGGGAGERRIPPARIATFGADAVICHGNGEDGSTPAGTGRARLLRVLHQCRTGGAVAPTRRSSID